MLSRLCIALGVMVVQARGWMVRVGAVAPMMARMAMRRKVLNFMLAGWSLKLGVIESVLGIEVEEDGDEMEM